MSSVRAANREEMFGLGGDGEEDPDVNPVDCEAYHARRVNLVKHIHRLLQLRHVRMIGRCEDSVTYVIDDQ